MDNTIASQRYWENRYIHGKTSGKGSYGKFAKYKAEVINTFIIEHSIQSVLDFGCGDGNQATYMKCDKYIGYDVSPKALELCKSRVNDTTKIFTSDLDEIVPCDLGLSCEVIFHLIEDETFYSYIDNLCQLSKRYMLIYSSNYISDKRTPKHVRHWKFTDYIAENYPEWQLIETIPNRYPEESFSQFYVYSKTNNGVDDNDSR